MNCPIGVIARILRQAQNERVTKAIRIVISTLSLTKGRNLKAKARFLTKFILS